MKSRDAGFSLVELLVVMMILMVVMGAIYGIWMGLGRTYAFANDDISAQTQARAAMGEMVQYIRTARVPDAVTVEAYDFVIPQAGPFSVTLWSDVTGAGQLQLIRFRVSPDPITNPSASSYVLYRDQGNASTCSFAGATSVRLVTSNVANRNVTGGQLFTYMDTNGSALPVNATTHMVDDPTQIRQIVINLRVDVDPSRSPAVNVLSSIVQPRNLRQY
jgi:prepilin-type N-terminal cleavage/methylation domain-containing protein